MGLDNQTPSENVELRLKEMINGKPSFKMRVNSIWFGTVMISLVRYQKH